MAIRPWALKALQETATAPPPAPVGGTWDDYIKPAVMAPLHVLGAGYRGIGTLASALENTVQTGDPLSGFKLGADAREGGLGGDAASALGFGDALQGVRDPFEVGADALRGAIGGKGPRDVDPEWEAAFRAAAPVTTGAEAAGTLAGQFATQAVLDPVMHGLGALGARAAQGGATAAEGAAKYGLLPEALTEGRDALLKATQATVPAAIQGLAPETAGAVAKGLGAAFVPGMAISAAENLAQAPAAIKQHGLFSPQAVETGGQGLVDAAFAGLGAYHALRGGHGTGEGVEEIKQAADEGVAQATPAVPPKAPYEAPRVVRREDLLESPDLQAEFNVGEDTLRNVRQQRLEETLGPVLHQERQRELEETFGAEQPEPTPAAAIPEPRDSATAARAARLVELGYKPEELDLIPPLEQEAIVREGRRAAQASPATPTEPTAPQSSPIPPIEDVEAFVRKAGQVSTSLLQREYKIPFRVAGDLVDALEARGVVSAADGVHPRQVLEPQPPVEPTTEAVPGEKFSVRPRTPEEINQEMETLLRGKRTKAVEKRLLDLRTEREQAQAAVPNPIANATTGKPLKMSGFRSDSGAPRTESTYYTSDREGAEQYRRVRQGGEVREDALDLQNPLVIDDPTGAEGGKKQLVKHLLKAGAITPQEARTASRAIDKGFDDEKAYAVADRILEAGAAKLGHDGIVYRAPETVFWGEKIPAQAEVAVLKRRPDLLSALDEVKPLAPGGTGQAPIVSVPRLWEHVQDRYAGDRAAFDRDLLALRAKGAIEGQKGDTGLSAEDLAGSTVDPAGGRLYAVAKRLPQAEEKASVGPDSRSPQPVAAIIERAKEVWKDRIARAEALEDGGTRLHMRDGKRLEIHPTGEILGAGPDIAGREGAIRGAWRPLGNADSYIRLVEGKATFPDFLHEVGHGAIWSQFNRSEQKALFEKHRQEIFDKLKIDSRRMTPKQRDAAEEIVVERMADDAERHLEQAQNGNLKATPGWFKRLWDYITRIVRAFKGPDYDSLVRDFATGQVFDRGIGERAARAVGEALRGGGEKAPAEGEKFQVRPDSEPKTDISSLRTAVDEAKREKERLQEKGRALRGPEVAANQAAVREATKRVKEAEEALLGAGKPLDENRPPLSIRGQSPRDARSGIGPDAPPRVELRKRYMQELRKEQGKEPFDWSSNVPQARRFLIPKVQRMLDTMTPEQLFAKTAPSPEKVMAQDAFIAGRRADREVLMAQKEKLLAEGKDDPALNAEAIANGFDLQIAEMTNLLTKYGKKQIEYNTAVARTLAAMNDIMSAGRSLPDSFLRDIFRKHPSISPEKATALADLVREGKYDALPDALFAAVEPGAWAKFLEYWKSGLVSAPGTLLAANPGGNVLESAARLAEAPFGVITDMLTTKLTGERSRTFGEAGAEAGAIKAEARPAWDAFKTDLGKIFRGEYGSLAELDETARKKGLHEMLQYPPAIGAGPKWAQKLLPTGHVGNAVRVPLYILSATDAMFRRLGVAAELGKLSHREAVKELGLSAPKEAVAARAREITAKANEPGSEYEHLLGRAQEEAAKRVFQNDAPALRSLKSLRANLKGPFGMPIGHLAIPFTDTPFNIFKMMIERSPLGGIGAGKAWKRFVEAKNEGKLPVHEMEKLRDNAIDLTARAALGSTMFILFIGAAKAGLMTGAGPTDPKAKKALMETGWQPYSFKIGDTYIPFNRFEPVSSILGFSADAVEIANKGERESYVKKAAAAFMTNALSKTYLQGLSDAAGLIVDPERYGPDYAASLVGSLVPNIVAKGAQAIDPVMRETRPPGTGVLGQIGATLQSRVPGASMALPEQRTLTGEVRERPNAGSVLGAAARFALPVQVTQRKAGSELQEEFARVGYTPPVPDRKIRVSGQDIILAPSEQDKLAEEYQKASVRATRLLASPSYKAAPDDADQGQRSKRKLLDRIYAEANDRFKARYASILRARARAKAAAAPQARA